MFFHSYFLSSFQYCVAWFTAMCSSKIQFAFRLYFPVIHAWKRPSTRFHQGLIVVEIALILNCFAFISTTILQNQELWFQREHTYTHICRFLFTSDPSVQPLAYLRLFRLSTVWVPCCRGDYTLEGEDLDYLLATPSGFFLLFTCRSLRRRDCLLKSWKL